jgi:hypothetical protein
MRRLGRVCGADIDALTAATFKSAAVAAAVAATGLVAMAAVLSPS